MRALEEFLELRRFGPADADSLDSEAVRTRFAAGQAAMDIDWADTGVLAGALVGAARIAGESRDRRATSASSSCPEAARSGTPRRGAWDLLPASRSVTFLAFGGWIAVVPGGQPERGAGLVLSRLVRLARSTAPRDVLDGSSGINPYRLSHLDDPAPWRRLLGDRQAADYLGVLRASLAAPQVARDLRLPGYRAYITALEDQLDRVMAGGATPEEGLRAAAAAWEALTDRLGRNSQRRHYREAMGLEE